MSDEKLMHKLSCYFPIEMIADLKATQKRSMVKSVSFLLRRAWSLSKAKIKAELPTMNEEA